jgi:hypothetical protein
MEKAICKKCGFEDEYESEEYGLYEVIGKCYHCNNNTYKENGELTRKEIKFKLLNNGNRYKKSNG